MGNLDAKHFVHLPSCAKLAALLLLAITDEQLFRMWRPG